MTGLLDGKIAFVTGGGSGIGRATALAFAGEGARVAVADLKAADDTVAAIVAAGGDAYAVTLDVTDERAVDDAVDGLVARWGRIDVAFNNAGVSLDDRSAPWSSVETFDRTFLVNQRGVMLCMAAELRHMAARQSGAIVNISSVAGLTGIATASYASTKHAVVGLTRSAALRFAGEGVRVNCVCPGAIVTPMMEALTRDPASRAFVDGMQPMGRMGEAREVAQAVLFLASDRASFITGQALAVDGGFMCK